MYVNIKTFWHGMAWKEGKWRAGTRGTWGDGWKWHMIRSMLAEKLSQDASLARSAGVSPISGTVQGVVTQYARIKYVLYATWLPCPGTDVAAFAGSLHVPAKIPCLVFVLWSHELLVAVGLGPGAVSLFELGWSELCCGSPGHIVLLRSWDSTAL